MIHKIKFKSNPFFPGLFIFIFLCSIYFLFKVYVVSPSENKVSYNNTNFYVLDLSIPANLDFCGEKIPSNNYEIRDDLEKEFFSSSYWKTNSLVLFRKAQKWFPYIEPILKQEGVPDDFKYLAVIESHLSNITSPAGASGFWQLLPASARNYGLEVNAFVDERYHVEKATKAACQHIKDAYAIFHNWTLSAAAYNRGIGGIQAALKKQNTNNYFDLLLNRETGSFVYRILAYKTLFSSPGHFGIKKKKWNYFPKIQYRSVKVDSSINNVVAFAKHMEIDLAALKGFNPWLLQNSLPNEAKKVYEFRIPKNSKFDYSSYLTDLKSASGDFLSSSESARQEDEVQAIDTTALATPNVVTEPKIIYHVTKDGETLAELAAKYNTREEDLLKWNHLTDPKSIKGHTLIIYSNQNH